MARFSALQALLGLLALSAQGVMSDDPGGDDSCPSENASGASACTQLQESLGDQVIMPSDEFAYKNARTINWSQTAWANPECIVRPDDIGALQEVVRTLVNESVPFAIRSGGHMTAPGFANTNNGVLIDMSRFRDLNYNEEDAVVEIGTGLRWGEVYPVLDEQNVTVIGARVLGVGVGGFTLGSGLSYLSDLYGFGCDNVVNYEVVLANGSAVNANETSNPDLWWALKGGANNFGIVTKFTTRAYPMGMLWGGIKFYTLDKLPELFDAMLEYQTVGNKDPYANLMLQAFPTNESIGAILNMVYHKPEENPAAFAPFANITTVMDTTKIQSFTSFLSGQAVPDIPRIDWHSTSFQPTANMYKALQKIVTTAPQLEEIEALTAGAQAFGIQPISESAIRAGNKIGGNALGLEAVNQTWLALDTGWWSPEADETAHEATRAMIEQIEAAAKEDGSYVEYIFMNDASYDQDVIGHYGKENVAKLQAIQKIYDPDLVFKKLVPGGFKVPAA